MKLDEVKNLIRKGASRNDAFADQFLRDAQAACAQGIGSPPWNDFKDKYFANDPETLQNLNDWAGDLCSNQHGTAAAATGGGGCKTITYYESNPSLYGGASKP